MQLKKVIFIFLIILYSINLVSAETITVSGTTGADIQNAINEAKSGDTITLPAGDYYITSRIYQKDKDLTIKGDGATLHINTGAVVHNGLFFEGSQITKQAATGKEGSNQVVLNDASRVQAGDLLKIWKDVKWCPTDYPGQMTGELYLVQSVSGNTVTLTEYLLREYPSGSDSIIYRPVEIHIEGLEIQDSESTKVHEAIALLYCVDSSVSDCTIRDSGFAGISFYCSFNVKAYDNDVRNCIKPGSGYGVGIWSGTAHADVYDNYIENCRHCITLNSDRLDTLTRDSHIYNNRCIGGQTGGAIVIDAHPIAIDWLVEGNDITVQSGWYALNDGAYNTVFQNNKIKGGYGAVIKRGDIKGGTHIIKDNTIEADNGFTYRAWGNSHCDNLVITGNTQTGGRYGVFLGNEQPETYENVIIRDNSFSRIINQGIYLDFQKDGCKAEISDNTFSKVGKQDIYINANSHAGKAIIKGNTLSKTNGLMLVGLTASDTGEIEYSYDESQEDADEEEPTHKTNTFTVTGYDGESDQEQINEALEKAQNGGTVDLGSAGTIETNGQTWETDGSADQVEINQAIQAGDHIRLSGDFCIDEPIYVDSGTTLDGQGTSKITLDDNVNRKSGAYKHSATTEYANPMIPLIGQSDTEIENIEIKGISFDGNYNNNLDLIKGRGFYNIIFFKHAVGVKVHDNYFTNSHGDSSRFYRCSNIQYYNNEADHLGHEGLFCIESQNIEAWNNRIENCIDNSFRVNNCDNVLIHDNYITSIQGTPGSGPGIQIQQDLKGRMRVEICNNYIVSTWGPGIWIVGTVGTNEENDIYVHDNAFLGTGLNGITWVSGIIWSSMDNVRVENNVFDSCYGGGITSFKVKGLSTAGSSFEVEATHNIFTDIQKRKNSGAGTGYAFDNNLDENHKMISDFNVLWGNEGNFKNVKQGANDRFQDPKLDSADTGWEWKNGAWYNEFVTIQPGSRWNPEDDDTGEIEDDEDAPIDGEFDSIFEVLELEYSTSGRTEQIAEDIPLLFSDEVDGLIAGGVKIVITDIISIDGVEYIPGPEAVQAQTKAILDPDLDYFTGHIKRIDKDLDIKLDNGTAYAVFTVKTHWYTVTKNPATGEKKKSKIKTSTSIFKDSCPVPLVMERPTEAKGILYEYPIHSLAYVPSNGLTSVEYEYDGKNVKHIYMIGERHKNEDGVIYTNFSKVNYWKGDLDHQGEFLFIDGSFDPEKLTVTAYTPYESFQVIHFDHIKKVYPDKFYADWLFPSFGLFLILGFGAWYYIRKILY